MQISLNLSETTIQHLKNLPDPDSFVEDLVKKALQSQVKVEKKPSKWALLVQEIEQGNYFNDYSEKIKIDAKEVREGFDFSTLK